jgi:putative DNA primase/helicase
MKSNQFEQMKSLFAEYITSADETVGTGPVRQSVTPDDWFAEKYPEVAEKYGDAIGLKINREGKLVATEISDDFFAGILGHDGTPAAPIVYVVEEDTFYGFAPESGIYLPVTERAIAGRLSRLLLECIRNCETDVILQALEFRLRKTAALKSVVERAKGLLESTGFFKPASSEHVACANGILRLSDRILVPFNSSFRCRNKLSVNFDPGAKCPIFLDTLMRPALSPDDLDLLQRWCGLAVLGINLAQVILILTGMAGGGKGTFIRILTNLLGRNNVGTLRTHLLTNRFELGRCLGRTLLYGADVPANFLNLEGASVLKSLTGGDPVTIERKNSNATIDIVCQFNVIATCNSHLRVRLEGDVEAWGRRLRIIEYRNPPVRNVITNLSELILREEGPGVLNWMLEGLNKIRADGWQLQSNDEQRRIVDDLLLESESYRHFARECLVNGGLYRLTVTDCYEKYVKFCSNRGWTALSRRNFGGIIEGIVLHEFSISLRHDVMGTDGKPQRGWIGLSCK